MSGAPSSTLSTVPSFKLSSKALRALVKVSILLDSLEIPNDPDVLNEVKNRVAQAFDNYLPNGARVSNIDVEYLTSTNSQTAELVMNRQLQNTGMLIVTFEKDFYCDTDTCIEAEENVDDLVNELTKLISDAVLGKLNSTIQNTVQNETFSFGTGVQINIEVGEKFVIQSVETKIIDLRTSPSPSIAPTTSSSLPCSVECNGDSRERFRIAGVEGWRRCEWVTKNAKQKEARCAYPEVSLNCCESCCSS